MMHLWWPKGLSSFPHWVGVGFLLLLSGILDIALVSGQELQTVNVVFFHEEMESVKAFNTAIDYINKNPVSGVKVGKVHRITSNGTDVAKLVEKLCQQLDVIRRGDEKPDVAIDFTRYGIPSEAVKIVVKSINLPTVSATFGQEGDIRSWRDLDITHASRYLVQISPPADILIQSVRSIVKQEELTNVAVLFDEQQFEMHHKYKSLLKNMPTPTQHLLTKVELDNAEIRKHIDRLIRFAKISNFFIAANPRTISAVLAEAADPEMRDGPYFRDGYHWFSMSLEEGYPKCTGCRSNNVTVVHLTPDFSQLSEKRRSFLAAVGTAKANSLTDLFYFDLTVNAILAVRKLKSDGSWKSPPTDSKCGNLETFNDTYEMDLYPVLNSEGTENILGRFQLSKNGLNYPTFQMKMEKLIFKEHQAEPETRERLGVWKLMKKDLVGLEKGDGNDEDPNRGGASLNYPMDNWISKVFRTVSILVLHLFKAFF